MRSLKIGWKFLVVAAVALLPLRTARAQGTGTLRGTVVDSTTQQPVGGAQVQLVGTNRVTFTDASGVYRFTGVTAGSATVRVQKIGFAQQTVSVNLGDGATAAADVMLRAVIPTLSQVVVVGYGSSNRSEVTGALTTVSASDIKNTPIAGIDAALQGKAAGVQVTQNAGNPGNGISVRVRGSSSLTASNQPLYVVDGVPVQTGDFSQVGFGGQDLTAVTNLNPDEIETITILKDAASAGIYGSRASNGVVMITTKRGIAGTNRITFNGYHGWQKADRLVKMMNAQQYVEYMAEGMRNDGYTDQDVADFGFVAGVNDVVNTDWQSLVYRTAPVRDMNLGLSGGSGRVKYYVSGSYYGQDGIQLATAYNRASGRANIDFDPTERLSLKASLGLSREINYRQVSDNTISGIGPNAIADQPNVPVRDPDGSFSTNSSSGIQYTNPLAIATYDYNPTTTNRVLANVEGTYNLLNWAQFTARVSGDNLVLHERLWGSPLVVDENGGVGGDATSAYNTGNRFVGEGFFTLTPWNGSSLGTLTAVLGASTERNRTELNFVEGTGFSSPALHDVGSATTVTVYDGSRGANNLLSYFARANLNLLDRYLASASFRADGSSRFGPNNRYGVFPAFSLGWVITQEPRLSALQRLGSIKLRGSVGTTGNQGIGNQTFRATFGSSNYGKAGGISPNNFGNPDLKWEQTREVDAGFDWTMFDGRIGVVGDWYKKKTSNLLVSRPITATSGFTSFTDNVGNIENQGVELELTTEIFRSRGPGSFSWLTSYNYSHNRNRVTALYQDQPIYSGIDGINSVRVGEPLGAFYTLKFIGVDPQTGDAMYQDTNGDGAINADDRVVVGNPQPTSWGSVTNTFAFGPFDLRAAVQFSGGNQIYNGIRSFSDDGGYYFDNKFAYALRRWQQPGDITDEPRPSFDGTSQAILNSSRLIEPGNYTRLQEVTFGMKVPTGIARVAGLQNTRLYVSGRNLKTWTRFKGYNPDVNSNGSGSSISLGQEFYSYPLARTWMVGLSTDW
ncbi:MAG TPA: SusC/RagA family TonB-linked outer membrane protein [Gemmatimonadaceae bacterium]|nr:SusC/RagA family TonB-linked outer membrane protein [Gemmatimonadaceae bacterium]